MYADDTAFIAHSHDDAQEFIAWFADSARSFGLKINITKTEMLYQTPPGQPQTNKDIHIGNQQLARVSKFMYLGSTVTDNNRLDEEIKTRMATASITYGKLKQRVWHNKNLTFQTKCAVYRATEYSPHYYMEQKHGLSTKSQLIN